MPSTPPHVTDSEYWIHWAQASHILDWYSTAEIQPLFLLFTLWQSFTKLPRLALNFSCFCLDLLSIWEPDSSRLHIIGHRAAPMHLKDTSTLPSHYRSQLWKLPNVLWASESARVERSCTEAPNTNTLENKSLRRHLQEQHILKVTQVRTQHWNGMGKSHGKNLSQMCCVTPRMDLPSTTHQTSVPSAPCAFNWFRIQHKIRHSQRRRLPRLLWTEPSKGTKNTTVLTISVKCTFWSHAESLKADLTEREEEEKMDTTSWET